MKDIDISGRQEIRFLEDIENAFLPGFCAGLPQYEEQPLRCIADVRGRNVRRGSQRQILQDKFGRLSMKIRDEHNTTLRTVVGLLCLLVFGSIFAIDTYGQVLYGSLTGTVTDPSGAAVVGAQVTALAVQTGVNQTATTDSSGIYRFAALLQGTYKVTISAQGFATQETPDVAVHVNEISRVNAELRLASATQSVTVTTEAPILQTDKADVHTDFSAQQIESLPIMGSQGANFQSLLRTVPGAGLTAETNSLAGNPQRAINTNMNGLSNQGSNTRIDGTQDAYPWLPANIAYAPPADAIESVNVTTNSFDAEQGLAGGAAVNVQIKSGTNHFHGAAHEYHTDQNFAARNYFNTDITVRRQIRWSDQEGQTLFLHRLRAHDTTPAGGTGYPDLADSGYGFGRFYKSARQHHRLRSCYRRPARSG
jgi:Carboxypeptidase regulatory-like domain